MLFSPQSPGQYYFKPMMKEFRFEPASQMITVEEGQNLSIDIIGIKTAYRYKMYLVQFSLAYENRNSCFIYSMSLKFFIFFSYLPF